MSHEFPQRIAGIDFGRARIGIAVVSTEVGLAMPLETYHRRGPVEDAKRFQQLVAEEGIDRFVVGLPVHVDGRESAESRAAREFGEWLAEQTGRPVEYFDERYTSIEAEELLREQPLRASQRKARRDALAAQIILTGYLEAGGGESSPGGLD